MRVTGQYCSVIDKSNDLSDYGDDSGDTLIAFTRKGLSGGEVAIRDSLAN